MTGAEEIRFASNMAATSAMPWLAETSTNERDITSDTFNERRRLIAVHMFFTPLNHESDASGATLRNCWAASGNVVIADFVSGRFQFSKLKRVPSDSLLTVL